MNTVRIISGAWRRRLLKFPDAEGLRPTPDRVRETLFNWLGQDMTGQSCLDLFAGSGCLGFEAASRGAARVVMVEQSPKVFAALESNARLLDNTGCLRIVRRDAVEFASSLIPTGARFDVIFLDPPYRQGWIERFAPLLEGLAAPDGLIYVEAEHALETLGEWHVLRHGRAGQVFYHLMQRGEKNGAE